MLHPAAPINLKQTIKKAVKYQNLIKVPVEKLIDSEFEIHVTCLRDSLSHSLLSDLFLIQLQLTLIQSYRGCVTSINL